MSFESIDLDDLAAVNGGEFGEQLGAAGISAAAQITSTLIQVVGPTVVKTVAGGLGSFLQSVLMDGNSPVADGALGGIKGLTTEIGGPVGVNAYTDAPLKV